MSVTYLLIISGFILFTSTVFSGVLWRHNRGNTLYGSMFYYWTLSSFYFLASGIGQKFPIAWRSVITSFFTVFLTPLLIEMLGGLFHKRPSKSAIKLTKLIIIAAFVAAIAAATGGVDIFWVDMASIWPAGLAGLFWSLWFLISKKTWKHSNSLALALAIVIVVQMLHSLDYPFIRTIDWLYPIGFAVYIATSIGLAIFLPSAMLHETHLQQASALEKLVEERTQELVQKQAEVVEATKWGALAVMSSGMAHEINNPLSIIGGSLAMIEGMNVADEKKEAFRKKAIARIQSGIARISNIIKDLSEISGTYTFKGGDTSYLASDAIKATIMLCNTAFEKHNIAMETTLDSDTLITQLPKAELMRALLALLHNAIDAVIANKDADRKIKVQTQFNGPFLEIHTIDSGKGVAPENRSKIFQPFFTTKAVGSGVGLGLTAAQGIIEAAHGSVFLDEAKSETTFVVRIPKS